MAMFEQSVSGRTWTSWSLQHLGSAHCLAKTICLAFLEFLLSMRDQDFPCKRHKTSSEWLYLQNALAQTQTGVLLNVWIHPRRNVLKTFLRFQINALQEIPLTKDRKFYRTRHNLDSGWSCMNILQTQNQSHLQHLKLVPTFF